MLRRENEMKKELRENMRGGAGAVELVEILLPEEMMNKGRMFDKITLKPGCSIGEHRHEGEAEVFYVISGTAAAHYNGKEITLEKGDMFYTGDGNSHDIANAGDSDLILIALILYS